MSGAYYHGSRKQRERDELRVILLGKTGAGKSAAGNTILGRNAFESELCFSSWTVRCQSAEGVIGGRKVAVIDTPGLFDTNFPQEEVLKKIKTCISLSAPGPHAFLVVLRLGRFTKEEQETVKVILSTFGEDAAKHSLVLFTHGDKLKKQSIESFISKSGELQELIELCGRRYHVFNNQVKDPVQSHQLMEKVVQMTMENGGHYTAKMFRKAKKASKKEKQRLSKELKAEEQQRRDTLKADVEGETDLTGGSKKHGKCVLQ